MHLTKKRATLLCCAGVIATLAACGGGGGGSSPGPSGTTSVQGSASLVIPATTAQSGARAPHFVSSGVISATVSVNATIVATADISPTSTLCQAGQNGTRTCTIPVTAPVGTDTFIVTLYDAAGGKGNVLGTGTATQAVGAANFTLPLTIGGVPKTVALYIDNNTFQQGVPSTLGISVQVKDAAGATIIGTDPFATPITLTNSDTSGHTHLSPSTLTAPTNTVNLVYDGGPIGSSITIGATGAGTTTVTPVLVTVIAAATPTPVPSVPSLGFGTGGGYSCSGTPHVAVPGTYLLMISVGQLDVTGNYVNEQSEWAPVEFLAGSPSPVPSGSPTPTPAPTPTPSSGPSTQVTLYTGTFTMTSPVNFPGQSGGCFYVVYFPNQQFGAGAAHRPQTTATNPPSASPVASPTASPSANTFAIGAPNVGDNIIIGNVGNARTITTLTLSVNVNAGTGTGTFALDDNTTTGTITINGKYSFADARKILDRSNRLQDALDDARAKQGR